jgi:hypothetical protein
MHARAAQQPEATLPARLDLSYSLQQRAGVSAALRERLPTANARGRETARLLALLVLMHLLIPPLVSVFSCVSA